MSGVVRKGDLVWEDLHDFRLFFFLLFLRFPLWLLVSGRRVNKQQKNISNNEIEFNLITHPRKMLLQNEFH